MDDDRPHSLEMPRAIVLVSDDNYFGYASDLVSSICLTNRIPIFWIQLVSEGQPKRVDARVNDQVSVILRRSIGDTSEQRRVYAASCRFEQILDVFELNPNVKSILYVDADSIVRGPLDDLFDDFEISRSIIGVRKRDEDYHPYLAGFLFFDRDRSVVLLDRLVKEVNERDPLWGVDQDVLRDCLSEHQGGQIHEINPRYACWTFNRNLRVWSAKGQSRRRSPEFIFESVLVRSLSALPRGIARLLLHAFQVVTALIYALHIRDRYIQLRIIFVQLLSRYKSTTSR